MKPHLASDVIEYIAQWIETECFELVGSKECADKLRETSPLEYKPVPLPGTEGVAPGNHLVTITFDGGTKHGNPGRGYGTYRITYNGDANGIGQSSVTHSFGDEMTNNQAELRTMILAIEGLMTYASTDPDMPNLRDIDLVIYGDSATAINGVSGAYEIKAPKLIPLVEQARLHLMRFRTARLEWRPRKEMYEIFGH